MTECYRRGVTKRSLPDDEADEEHPLVFIGEDLAVYRDVELRVTDEGDYDVSMVARYEAGRRHCTELTVRARLGGRWVTSDGLRGLPVARMLREAEWQQPHLLRRPGASSRYGSGEGDSRAKGNAAYQRARRNAERQGRRRITDEDLRRVAEVYRSAGSTGRPPTAAVEHELHLRTRAQAARWVRRAREEGFLNPAPGPRQQGEQQP